MSRPLHPPVPGSGASGRGRCSRLLRAAVLSCAAAVFVLCAPAGAGAQSGWANPNDFRTNGPLFWLPEAHANWPRLASMWLPVDACSGDPYNPSGTDVQNQSCAWSYRIWGHRSGRSDAETEFGRGTSFDHDDLNTSFGTNPEMNPWHWRLSGMPESQRCLPADRDITTHKYSGGWGGLQVSQHIGEWYQGNRYLPDMAGDLAGVVLYGYFDFDVYSRPADMTQWQEGECAAHAVYDQYHTGAGGRTAGDARQCAATSIPLIMRGNSELRCEPDLELWETHVYAEDFKEILERHMDPMEEPTRADGWWPRPGDTFTHEGVVRDLRAFLRSVGMNPPFQPQFPHNWRDECRQSGEVFDCGPGDTERDRLADPQLQEEYGSRPLMRRFELMIAMPGEGVDDTSPRGIPDEWVADFSGFLSQPLGDTPTEARENRTDSFSVAGDPDFGSREWLQDFLTDESGQLRFVGARLADVLDDALSWSGDAEVKPADCLRLLPTDEPVADRAAAVLADEFWNSPEWRACAGRAFSSGGTARLSAGITGLNTWLRHHGGDVDRERNLEVAETNLDMDGWAVGRPEVAPDYQLGMPEVPAANQAQLNGLLGLNGSEVAWYRTGGSEISCLWGGFVQTDLVASAQLMEDHARSELEDRVAELVDVQEALVGELGEVRRPDVRTWSGGRSNERSTSLGCSGDGVRDVLNEWDQENFQETCQCNTTILGGVEVVDCPTSRQPDQSGQPVNAPMCTTSSWTMPGSSYGTESDDTCTCGGTSTATTCNTDGTSTTVTTTSSWSGALCQVSTSSQNNGQDPSCVGSCSSIAEECDGVTGFRFYRDSCGVKPRERRQDSSCPQPPVTPCDWVDDACDGATGFRFQVRDPDSCPSPHRRRVAAGPGECVACTPEWSVACDTDADGNNIGTWTWTDAKSCAGAVAPTGQDPTCRVSCTPSWSAVCDVVGGANTGTWSWVDSAGCPAAVAPTTAPNPVPVCGSCTWTAACDTDSNGNNIGTWTWTGAGACAGQSPPTGQDPDCLVNRCQWTVACDTDSDGDNTGTWTWISTGSCAGQGPPAGRDPTCNVPTPRTCACYDCLEIADEPTRWAWVSQGSKLEGTCGTEHEVCPGDVMPEYTLCSTDSHRPVPCTPTWIDGVCEVDRGGNMTGSRWQTASGCTPAPADRLVSDPSCASTNPNCACYDCREIADEPTRWAWVFIGSAPAGSCGSQAEVCSGDSLPENTLCSAATGGSFAPPGAGSSIIGRSSRSGGVGALSSARGRLLASPVSRTAAPGRASVQDSVAGASRAFMNDGSRSGVSVSPGASGGSPSANPALPGGVSDWVRSRAERAREQARRYAAEPTDRRSFGNGVRAMRDGVALAEVIAANRLEASLGASTGGPPPSAPVGAGGFASGAFAPLSRSTERASVQSAAGAADVPLAAAAPGPSGGVWAAADRGTDVAAGGWYGWNVDGRPCLSGTACADAMVRAFTTQTSWTIPSSFNCTSNVGFVGPFCLNEIFEKRQQLMEEIILWAGTMQGWIAIKEYRQDVYSQAGSNSSPYIDWSTFDGSMPNVAASSYVTAETGLALANPMCVLPAATNPVPLHAMGEQDTVAYGNANDVNSPAIWDDTGTRRLSVGGLGQGVWPPTDALQDVVLRGGDTRTMAPGRYEAGETLLELREMYYGDQYPEQSAPYDPESFDRFGAPSVQNFDPADYPNMPRTLEGIDHLTNPSFLETSVIFRELSCPAVDEAGSYGSIRPIVCQDGTVRTAPLLPDHRTSCVIGTEGCEVRVFSEPVLATGGAGYDARRLSGAAPSEDDSYADLFGPHFRHICQFDSSGMITGVLDGRVAADDAVTATNYQSYAYHWRAGAAPADAGEWVSGAGVGDGLEHGHNPDEGYYPRAGWYTDQNGDEVWFEPFSSYDNYGDVQSAGDFSDGQQELIMRGDAANPGELFVEHVEESRILYDEFIATPYEVQARNADFQLWAGARSGDVNTDDAHLVWGWPTLDLQDDQTDVATRIAVMSVRRLTTQQKLFGVPPGTDEAEQIWVRNDGPMSFFGATRVGNGTGGSEKGGCLLEVNPPEPRSISQGEAVPFRQVLDPTLQAWCVMARDVGPEDSCISMPTSPLPALRRQQ